MELLIPILLIVVLGVAANLFGHDSRDSKPNWPTTPSRVATHRLPAASGTIRSK